MLLFRLTILREKDVEIALSIKTSDESQIQCLQVARKPDTTFTYWSQTQDAFKFSKSLCYDSRYSYGSACRGIHINLSCIFLYTRCGNRWMCRCRLRFQYKKQFWCLKADVRRSYTEKYTNLISILSRNDVYAINL